MKKIVQFFIVLCLPVFIWSCEKEVKLNSIEGKLSPGTEITQDNLANIPMVLVKIYDTIDFATVKLEARNYEEFYSTISNAGGNYSFDSLPDGNYLLACGYGFKFADVDYVPVSASNGSINQVNKTVNRLPSPNSPETYEIEIQNRTFCTIRGIEFFVNNASVLTRDIFVGKGYEDDQYEYFDFVLDEAQNPAFQLSIMKQDTLVKTSTQPFFTGWWTYYDITVGNETVVIEGISEVKILKLYKGWFFGHWIKLEYFKPDEMNAGN
jgi:hypothetical protein